MSNIIEKLGAYQILTNLLPGIFFSLCLEFLFDISLPTENIVEDIVIYYFIGFIISRIGSLIIEPFLKKINFIKFAPYNEFLKALKKDSKIDTLSELNNFLRSLLTSVTLLPLVKLGQELSIKCPCLSEFYVWIILIVIFLLFLFSYQKQTNYVRKRVDVIKEHPDENKV
ncbi:hypothetical protein [Ruminococcus sp.]